jgi:3-oxoacyl-[acyl-carrier-protein] synthase-3
MAGMDASDVGVIVVATASPDYYFPATATLIGERLGAAGVPGYDLSAACTGFVFALAQAYGQVASGLTDTALVVGSEVFSRLLDWDDRSTCVLFGDGAGAVVVGRAEPGRHDGPPSGVISTKLFTDGSLASSLIIPGGGSDMPLTHRALDEAQDKVQMVGRDVFKVAVKNLTSASKAALDAAGLSGADIDWVVAHQANLRILMQVAGRLDIPLERFVINIERYGNTSSASIPIALDEAVRDGRIKSGQTVLMCALGAGISWGSALVRM